jgi:hypothetical protein
MLPPQDTHSPKKYLIIALGRLLHFAYFIIILPRPPDCTLSCVMLSTFVTRRKCQLPSVAFPVTLGTSHILLHPAVLLF